MNILISTWSLQIGGGEVLAMNLAAELVRRGHFVFIFNQRDTMIDNDLVNRLLPPQVQVLSMAEKPWGRFWAHKVNALQHRLGLPATFFERYQQAYLMECLSRYRIELISSHATFSDRLCAPVAHRMQLPLVITEHGEYSRFILEGRRDFAAVLQSACRILTVSKYNQQVLQQAVTGLPQVQTIYNGVTTDSSHNAAEMRHHLSLPDEAFVFGMVARGIADKGWEQAIQAFKQFRVGMKDKRPVRLVLVGGSEYLNQLQLAYAADKDIVFVGQVPNPDFYIAGFDVGLLPTFFPSEALPLVIIEYMMNGKPVIATRIGGISELLESDRGFAGQLVELDAITQTPSLALLVQAMHRYYVEPDLYAKHAHNARLASQQFTMQTCTTQYEHVFQQVLVSSA